MEYKKSVLVQFIKKEWLILMVLCFGVSDFLYPRNMYLIGLLCPILFFKVNFIKYIDVSCVLLFLFSIFYISFGYAGGSINLEGSSGIGGDLFYYLLYPSLFYLIGSYFFDRYHNPVILLFLLFIVIFSFSVYSFMLSVVDIERMGVVNESRMIVQGVQGDDIHVKSATLYGVIYSASIAGIGMFFAYTSNKAELIFKWIFVFLGLFGLFCVIHLVNRSGLFVAFCCVVASALYFSKIRFLFLRIVIIFILLLCILSIDTELRSNIYNPLSKRIEGTGAIESGGGRFSMWKYGIINLIEFPFGYDKKATKEVNRYAHNLWLDSGRVAGVVPMFLLIFLTLISFKNFFLILKTKKVSPILLCLLLNLNISFFLSSCVEPVIEGCFLYFLIYIMLFGAQNQIKRNIFVNSFPVSLYENKKNLILKR